jgi:HEAT repeat protein
MAAALQPGLTATEWAAHLANYPGSLPAEVVELYQWRNGSTSAMPCELLPMHRWLSLAEALEQYQLVLAGLQDDDAPDDLAGNWLPILLEDANFYLVLVTQPDQSPVVYRSESQDVVAEFDSLTSMMMAIADCWETGTYYLAGTEDWPYVDSDDVKETKIWLNYQPQQQAEMMALLADHRAEILPEHLPRAYSNLVYSQHPQATAIILQDLPTAIGDQRHHLMSLLGDLTDLRALTTILALVQSNHETDAQALLALQAWVQRGVKDDRIVEALLAMVQAVNSGECLPETGLADLYLVAEMLGDLGDRRAVEPLLQLLQRPPDKHNFEARQQQIVIALGKLGDDRASGVLVAIAQSMGDLMLRLAAAQALTMLGDVRGTRLFQKLTLKQFTGESV